MDVREIRFRQQAPDGQTLGKPGQAAVDATVLNGATTRLTPDDPP